MSLGEAFKHISVIFGRAYGKQMSAYVEAFQGAIHQFMAVDEASKSFSCGTHDSPGSVDLNTDHFVVKQSLKIKKPKRPKQAEPYYVKLTEPRRRR